MGSESALIVPVPEVEPVVGRLRLLYDPAAQLGVPAHITLLYPFGSPRAACDAVNRLEDLFASFQAFRFAFTQVRRFPATTYLHPDRPEAFAQIIRTLIKTWPDRQPYGGAFPEIIPHLTVADRVGPEVLSVAEDSLRPQLPIHAWPGKPGW
jgi:hypothetical protein